MQIWITLTYHMSHDPDPQKLVYSNNSLMHISINCTRYTEYMSVKTNGSQREYQRRSYTMEIRRTNRMKVRIPRRVRADQLFCLVVLAGLSEMDCVSMTSIILVQRTIVGVCSYYIYTKDFSTGD